MKTVETYTANIYVGLKEGYDGRIHHITAAEFICQEYCNEVGLGLTFTPTKFIYTDGNEPGAIIGLINYPRFPKTKMEIKGHAKKIARMLLKQFNQERLSIVFSDETVMIERNDI